MSENSKLTIHYNKIKVLKSELYDFIWKLEQQENTNQQTIDLVLKIMLGQESDPTFKEIEN